MENRLINRCTCIRGAAACSGSPRAGCCRARRCACAARANSEAERSRSVPAAEPSCSPRSRGSRSPSRSEARARARAPAGSSSRSHSTAPARDARVPCRGCHKSIMHTNIRNVLVHVFSAKHVLAQNIAFITRRRVARDLLSNVADGNQTLDHVF